MSTTRLYQDRASKSAVKHLGLMIQSILLIRYGKTALTRKKIQPLQYSCNHSCRGMFTSRIPSERAAVKLMLMKATER
jgi:hypothetical protein